MSHRDVVVLQKEDRVMKNGSVQELVRDHSMLPMLPMLPMSKVIEGHKGVLDARLLGRSFCISRPILNMLPCPCPRVSVIVERHSESCNVE